MKNQLTMKVSLVLTLVVCVLMSVLEIVQSMWVFAQGNLSQVLNQTSNQTSNQTGNQTGNQSLSSAIPGQQGGTPPKMGPS
jgi:ABC-type molybdate transport system substrate-binding protein